MVNLGDRVKDRINGCSGIVTGRAEYLYGCVQVLITPEELTKEGKRNESFWLDEDRVEAVSRNVHSRPATAVERAGGPQQVPPPIR